MMGAAGREMIRRLIASNHYISLHLTGLPRWLSCKETACQCKRHRFNPWVRKIPWRRKWQPAPVLLAGESHGQRRLGGYSRWGY